MADSQKVAVAKSIAINGSQGPAMLQAAAQSAPLAAEQSEALKTAAARAGAINAPEAFLRQQAAQIAEPFNTAGAKEASDSSALHSYLGSMGGAHANYLSELAAATPIAQAQVNKAGSAQNLNQMMQLLNAQQNAQQWEWQKEDRATKQTALDQDKSNVLAQSTAQTAIVSHPVPAARAIGVKLLASPDVNTALSNLEATKNTKPTDKAARAQWDQMNNTPGAWDDLERNLVQYFDPHLASTLPPRSVGAVGPMAPVQAGSKAAPKKQSGILPDGPIKNFLRSLPRPGNSI